MVKWLPHPLHVLLGEVATRASTQGGGQQHQPPQHSQPAAAHPGAAGGTGTETGYTGTLHGEHTVRRPDPALGPSRVELSGNACAPAPLAWGRLTRS